jgi:hypothetical protein
MKVLEGEKMLVSIYSFHIQYIKFLENEQILCMSQGKGRTESRLKEHENRVLRRKFGCEREGVTGEQRRIHNEVYNLYINSII